MGCMGVRNFVPLREGNYREFTRNIPFEAETAGKVASGVSPFVAEAAMKLCGVTLDMPDSESTVPRNTSSSKVQI